MADDLHARLVNALTARLERARAASQYRDSSTPTGEHWRWECGNCDTTIEITPVTILDEVLQCPNCESYGADLRSVEHYPNRFVGELPHMITHSVEEIRPIDAAYIAGNDPASEIRRVEATLRVVERHVEDPHTGRCVYCVEWCDCMDMTQGDDYEQLGEAWSNCIHGNRAWPCDDIRDLAEGEGLMNGDT